MTTSDLSPPEAVEFLPRGSSTVYDELLRTAPEEHRTPVWLGREDCGLGILPVPDDPVGAIEALDPHQILAEWWPGPCPDGCACLEPFLGQLPELTRDGVADRSRSRRTLREAHAMADDVVATGPADLVAVRASRPADIPAIVGWGGAGNYRQENAEISAVLRSWEERFGAVLTVMNRDTLLLSVAYPPTTFREAEQVATEHFAFCPDQHDPQDMKGTVYTPRSYGRMIRNANHWRFWWD